MTARVSHQKTALGASVVRQAHEAGRNHSAGRECLVEGHRADVHKERGSLPLTTVNGASGLALCVKDLGSRAHLQLSAGGGGRRVQSIGGAIRGCCSGHGESWRDAAWGVWEQVRAAGRQGLPAGRKEQRKRSMR